MGMEYTAHSQIPGMGMEYTLGPWNGNGIYWVLDHYNVSVCHTALAAVCVKIFIFPSKLL